MPPPRSRGFWGPLITLLAVVLLVVSLITNLVQLVGAFSADRTLKQTTIHTGDLKQVVAVIPIVNNMILHAQAVELEKVLKEVGDDDNVKAVVLRIDTPGGEVTASDEMYQSILDFKLKRQNVPVYVSMGGLATSGGYYTACGADYLVAEPTTLTANIGVLAENINISKLAEKYGVEDQTLHSTGADFKTAGSMLKTPTAEDTAYLQALIDSMADRFHDVVKKGRRGRLKAPMATIFNAQAYTATAALSMGLVDQIGYLDDTCKAAASKAGLTNPTIVKYEEPSPLLAFLQARSPLPDSEATGDIKINGMPVEIPALHQMLDRRPMYLYAPR
jgi:protease-4